MRLKEDWKHLTKASSFRLSLFWGALNGAVLSIEAFQSIVNPWVFLGLNTVGFAVIAIARLTKQPGLE